MSVVRGGGGSWGSVRTHRFFGASEFCSKSGRCFARSLARSLTRGRMCCRTTYSAALVHHCAGQGHRPRVQLVVHALQPGGGVEPFSRARAGVRRQLLSATVLRSLPRPVADSGVPKGRRGVRSARMRCWQRPCTQFTHPFIATLGRTLGTLDVDFPRT